MTTMKLERNIIVQQNRHSAEMAPCKTCKVTEMDHVA